MYSQIRKLIVFKPVNYLIYLKKINLKLDDPINEQDEYVRIELAKLWGDDIADYFVDSKIDYFNAKKSQEEALSNGNSKIKKKQYSGLYAHQIWRGIREESNVRLKPFDLSRELQVLILFYIQFEIQERCLIF